MKLAFLEPSDPRWAGFLAGVPHQFYHLPGFCSLWAEQDGGDAEAVLITEGESYLFIPYIARSILYLPPGMRQLGRYRDLRSPYGYPGPLHRSTSPTFYSRAIAAWANVLRKRRFVSGFVRLDPLNATLPTAARAGGFCCRGETVSVDLRNDTAATWKVIRHSTRQAIRKAEAHGVWTEMIYAAHPWQLFAQVYRETMSRVGAHDSYRFSVDHLTALAGLLGDKLCLCLARSPAGEVLAAGVFVEHQEIVQHHLQGTSEAGLQCGAAKAVVFAMIDEARRRGNQVLHLGGGVGGACDSLFQFKSGFSHRRHPYLTWHLSFLPRIYSRIASRMPPEPRTSPAKTFFPAYRRATVAP